MNFPRGYVPPEERFRLPPPERELWDEWDEDNGVRKPAFRPRLRPTRSAEAEALIAESRILTHASLAGHGDPECLDCGGFGLIFPDSTAGGVACSCLRGRLMETTRWAS